MCGPVPNLSASPKRSTFGNSTHLAIDRVLEGRVDRSNSRRAPLAGTVQSVSFTGRGSRDASLYRFGASTDQTVDARIAGTVHSVNSTGHGSCDVSFSRFGFLSVKPTPIGPESVHKTMAHMTMANASSLRTPLDLPSPASSRPISPLVTMAQDTRTASRIVCSCARTNIHAPQTNLPITISAA